MNTVSTFLYFAEVLGGFKALAGLFATLGFVIYAGKSLGRFIATIEDTNPEPFRSPSWWLPVCIAFAVAYVLTPSENTMYMVAASEMTEVAAESDVAQRIAAKLEGALDSLLGD